MKKILLASDMDNTIMYSRRHMPDDINRLCVEIYQGEEQGFLSAQTVRLLRQVCQAMRFVPLTTRSLAQYRRIEWPSGCRPQLALTTNGAILLKHDRTSRAWLAESKRLAAPYMAELMHWQAQLTADAQYLRCRLVDDMYLFGSCAEASVAADSAARYDSQTSLLVRASGRKVYFFPPGLDKGTALTRLKKMLRPAITISAGDSEIDAPMLARADLSFAPASFPAERLLPAIKGRLVISDGDSLFAEQFLRNICHTYHICQR